LPFSISFFTPPHGPERRQPSPQSRRATSRRGNGRFRARQFFPNVDSFLAASARQRQIGFFGGLQQWKGTDSFLQELEQVLNFPIVGLTNPSQCVAWASYLHP
jgi:hypothetical protein